MNTRFIDWIWQIRGSLALAPGQSGNDALGRLDPLFRQPGTSHEQTGDTLVFQKRDQAAQDKMSIFDGGVLRIEKTQSGPVLHYRLTSRALLFCFLAPLFFLAIAQLTIAVANFQKPAAEAAGKGSDAKKAEKKKAEVPMHPIDTFLGAPAPEKPDKKKADKAKDDDKPTPTAAYIFAGIFAALYLVGRILESWLIKGLFRRSLLAPSAI